MSTQALLPPSRIGHVRQPRHHAPGVRAALTRIFRERTSANETGAQAAWLPGLRATDRFVEGIWGGRGHS